MEVKLLSGALGAEINGINLKDCSKDNWIEINKFASSGNIYNQLIFRVLILYCWFRSKNMYF